MSLTLDGDRSGQHRLRVRRALFRLLIMAAAFGLALAVMAMIGWWLSPGQALPAPRSPFGVGLRETAPNPRFLGGFGSQLMAWQSGIFRDLTRGVSHALQDGSAAMALVGGSFLYGVIHAAGPGHGKMVIASYIVADGHRLKRGIAMSCAAALLQALVAIALVTIMALVLRATAGQVDGATRIIEMAAFAMIAAAGLVVLWRKAGALAGMASGAIPGLPRADACAPGCGHDLLAMPGMDSRNTSWRELALVVTAAGARPCMGAIVVLTFAAAQGLFLVGVLSVLAMAAGVALATSSLATLAFGFKALALQLAGGRGLGGSCALLALECLAAAFVAALGMLLLLGLGAAGGS